MTAKDIIAPSPRAIELLAALFQAASQLPETSVLLQPLSGPAEASYREHGDFRSFQVWVGGEVARSLQTPFCPIRSEVAGRWYGNEQMQDSAGNIWERRIRAVVDNFGDLVEVRA